MDTFLAIVSRREVRDYEDRPVDAASIDRVIDAGRVSGSSKNRQPWKLLVIHDRSTLDDLAAVITRPTNLQGAAFAIAFVLDDGATPFDAGRATQNMMLAAWNEGVGSCPNSIKDLASFKRIVGFEEGRPVTLLTFGFPAKKARPEGRGVQDWIAAANRKPKEETVIEVDDYHLPISGDA